MVTDSSPVVGISPKSMVDSVADWPLHRVIEHLKKKEKEEKSDVEMDCRLFHTSGIRLFNAVVDELAGEYDLSRGRMCRCLSYHGAAMAKDDKLVADLDAVCTKIRRAAIRGSSHSITCIQENPTPYAPVAEDGRRVSFYVYNSWVLSDFSKLGQLCGVAPAQVAQIYMIRSILTCDLPSLEGALGKLAAESEWWDKWMRYRLSSLEMAVAMWGSE